MRIRDILADLIGILCLFGLLYAGLMFGERTEPMTKTYRETMEELNIATKR